MGVLCLIGLAWDCAVEVWDDAAVTELLKPPDVGVTGDSAVVGEVGPFEPEESLVLFFLRKPKLGIGKLPRER